MMPLKIPDRTSFISKRRFDGSFKLFEKSPRKDRKIIGYDNVGDPIYEGDQGSSGGINLLGLKLDLDAPTLSIIIFGLIAFNFFVLANL